MKKQTLLLLLSSLMLGSCQNVFVSDSSDVYIPTDDVSQEDSSSEEVKDSSSSVQVDSSSTEDIVDKDINVNEVKDVTDFLGSDNDVYRVNITTKDKL